MLTDTPVLIILIVVACGSFAIALFCLPLIKKDPRARVAFMIFMSLGLFVSYGLSIQKDNRVIFERE